MAQQLQKGTKMITFDPNNHHKSLKSKNTIIENDQKSSYLMISLENYLYFLMK